MRVLIAEDDRHIAAALAAALTSAGFVAETVHDGEDAHFRGETEDFDAVILDLGLPTIDGLTILKRWRKAGRTAPVLVLTARGHWEERVEGIEAGADDYVVKPFHVMEIAARLRALVRRVNGHATSLISFGPYQLNLRTMAVTNDGLPIDLSPQEFKLVSYLVQNRGKVLSQLQITEHIYNQDFERDSNVVEVLVARVRKRLAADIIKTRRGFGYTLGDGY